MDWIMQNKLLSTDFKERVLKFYQSIDCKYIVLKVEDLLNSINEQNYLALINMLDDYNAYRSEHDKPENKYFVVNLSDTRFDKASDFFEWLNNKNNQSKSE